MTHERLEQLQKYAREQDYVSKFSLQDLPHERRIEENSEKNDDRNKMVRYRVLENKKKI